MEKRRGGGEYNSDGKFPSNKRYSYPADIRLRDLAINVYATDDREFVYMQTALLPVIEIQRHALENKTSYSLALGFYRRAENMFTIKK